MRWLAAAVLTVLAVGCARTSDPGRIEGRVSWGGKGVGSALVGAYPKEEQDTSIPPVGEASSRPDGSFRLDVPPGRYWLWARATLSGESRSSRLVGKAAANPIQVLPGREATADIVLADPSGFSASAGPAGTGVRGRVAGQGPGQGRILVAAYREGGDRPVGPGFVAARAPGPDGGFQLDLPPGRYTVTARWRASGTDFGELSSGDRVAVVSATVRSGAYCETGMLVLRGLDQGRFRSLSKGSPKTATAVGGRVLDAEGRGVGGIRVLAFRDSKMAGKPLALSAPTGADGDFLVYLPGKGVYFLGARSRLGGPAEPGERVGSYRGEEGSGLTLAEGESKNGVEVKVEEVW